jgi:NitT/TauT family transport system substrate-binding protein
MTKITVLFPQQAPSPDWPHLWVADEMGYYREENLEVEIQPTQGSVDSVRLLSVSRGDISLAGSDALLITAAQGAPVKAVYTHQHGTIFGIAVLESSPYRSVADLKGKTIGVSSFGSAAFPVAKALMTEAGMNPETDATFVEVGTGAPAATALRAGRIDAAAHWDTQFYTFEREGLKLRIFESPKFADYFGAVASVRDETIQQNPAVVEAFLRAFNKGVVFSLANPEAAVDLMGKKVPAVLQNRDLSIGIFKVRAEKTWGLPAAANGLWGWNSPARWEAYQNFLLETDQLKSPVDISKAWDDRFLRAASSFDQEAVRQQARNWKP